MTPGQVSAIIYTGASLIAALVFFIITLVGDYSWVARIGGSVWICALCMIILMPTVTPWVRDRMNRFGRPWSPEKEARNAP